MAAEGDRAALKLVISGTQTKPVFVEEDKTPPTDKRSEVTYAIFRSVNAEGQISELHEFYDTGGFMRQLGTSNED